MENLPTTEKCAHCGASTKAYLHSLNAGLVAVLIKAIKHITKTGNNKFHYKDLNLNYSEASNLQKLRFHGLIAHYSKENTKSGEWLITSKGGQFLRGEISVPKQVKTFRNKVLGHSEETIHISALKHKFPDFQSEYAYEYQRSVGLDIPKQASLLANI